MHEDSEQTRVPIVEEHARVDKRVVEKAVVRIRASLKERTEWLTEELTSEEVTIERVAIDQEIDSMPSIREEDGAVVIPVVEQRLVVEKRWVLKEELYVRKKTRTDAMRVPVTLRTSDVSVERRPAGDSGAEQH